MPHVHDTRDPFEVGRELVIVGTHVAVVRIIASDETMCIYLVHDDRGNELVVKEIYSVHYYHDNGGRFYGFRNYKGGPWELRAHLELSQYPNIVKCIGGHYFREDRARYHMLMEYAPYGDLCAVIRKYGRVDYNVAWAFFDQIVGAIGSMHREDRFHAGVGPRNVFVFSTELCKLGDFGNGGFLPPALPGVRIPNHTSTIEAVDILGAAECVLYMLLGKFITNQQVFDKFLEIKTEEDVAKLFIEQPQFAKFMAPADCWYIRQFYWPFPTNSVYPLPPSYGLTRKSVHDQLVDEQLEELREQALLEPEESEDF